VEASPALKNYPPREEKKSQQKHPIQGRNPSPTTPLSMKKQYNTEMERAFDKAFPLERRGVGSGTFRRISIGKFISFIRKEEEKIFNSKKGTTIYIPKRDGTEQVWRLVEVRKWR